MPHPWKHSKSGWTGSEQADVVEVVSVHCRGVGLDDTLPGSVQVQAGWDFE